MVLHPQLYYITLFYYYQIELFYAAKEIMRLLKIIPFYSTSDRFRYYKAYSAMVLPYLCAFLLVINKFNDNKKP